MCGCPCQLDDRCNADNCVYYRCKGCDGTVESCQQSRIKCCPDCSHDHEEMKIAVVCGLQATEYFCAGCGQLRLNLRPETPVCCVNCASSELTHGAVGSEDLLRRKLAWRKEQRNASGGQ
jgi:hypothetical protein